MKSLRYVVAAVLVWFSVTALAQDHEHGANAQTSASSAKPAQPAPKSEAQKSFGVLKTLAGSWQARVTLDPPMAGMSDALLDATMRVTSRGNTIVHEFQEANTPLDPAKYDHPITMLYLDDDKLTLIHYCDAGNRPRMVARPSADGKTVEFDFVDIAGPTKYGHMHHAVFTFIDANHHTEDWTYMTPGDKPMHAHMDLTRKNDGGSASGK
jgi:hypothetical protein